MFALKKWTADGKNQSSFHAKEMTIALLVAIDEI